MSTTTRLKKIKDEKEDFIVQIEIFKDARASIDLPTEIHKYMKSKHSYDPRKTWTFPYVDHVKQVHFAQANLECGRETIEDLGSYSEFWKVKKDFKYWEFKYFLESFKLATPVSVRVTKIIIDKEQKNFRFSTGCIDDGDSNDTSDLSNTDEDDESDFSDY
ncbi:hypothetical protein CYY_008177 [Polysphondylium violaceum]|uniref:Uncharacterized protein n=1 Tax=Polysphondylium violaceum TaxID=133409 RepID=A0A8J4PVS6_9MYCE|nr:hypothetical protein CYY_008177 [Polysphondylium violaceum]